jgi:hypothetical protein
MTNIQVTGMDGNALRLSVDGAGLRIAIGNSSVLLTGEDAKVVAYILNHLDPVNPVAGGRY